MRKTFLITCAAVLALSACQRQEAAQTEPPPPEQAPPTQDQAAGTDTPRAEAMRLAGANTLVIDDASDDAALAAATCNPSRQGAVSLTTDGAPGDTFQITLMCGGQTVAQCAAAIPVGARTAHCSAGPNAQPVGPASCVVQPGNANGANAKATWACAY